MAIPSLSIVIPAFNEQSRLGRTLSETLAFGSKRAIAQIVVVDDGSTDATSRLVATFGARDPRVELLPLDRNRGKGAAVRAGVARTWGDRVLVMDADLATPLGELAALETALDAGAAVAIGSRAVDGSIIEARQHPARQALGQAFNVLVRGVLGVTHRDTQCGFKLFHGEVARALFARTTIDRYAFDVEVILLAERASLTVAEVPVRWRHVERSRVSPFIDAPRMAFDVLRLRFLRR